MSKEGRNDKGVVATNCLDPVQMRQHSVMTGTWILELQQNCFQASILSPINVRMGKFPNFSTLQFPYLQNKNIKHTS